jgi:hypothetical protein
MAGPLGGAVAPGLPLTAAVAIRNRTGPHAVTWTRRHHAMAQIWQFGIPRSDSLRIRRRTLNRRSGRRSGPESDHAQ